jgi:hypothetical protein
MKLEIHKPANSSSSGRAEPRMRFSTGTVVSVNHAEEDFRSEQSAYVYTRKDVGIPSILSSVVL